MHALYLPGNSPGNREPTYELAGKVTGFRSSTVWEYPHWDSAEPDKGVVDLDETGQDIVNFFAGRNERLIVIAKSMGVNLCLLAQLMSDAFNPDQVVFYGAAINGSARESGHIDRWLKNYRTPSLWIQQEKDPVLPAEELKQYLDTLDLVGTDFVALDGDTHEYDPEVVATAIGQHLDASQEPS